MKWTAGRSGFALLSLVVLSITCGTLRSGVQKWDRKWGPLVPHESFPGSCDLCHEGDDWSSIRADFSFDHEKETGHALEGAHAGASCLRCHNDLGPVAMYAERGCAGCHADIHQGQMGSDCRRCHTETSWRAFGLVAEHARTRFPLVGRHLAAACVQCHREAPTGIYRGAPVRCEQCHAGDLARAVVPDHRAQGWTARCERCHTPVAWDAQGFTHSFFPLTGAHATARCEECHSTGTFGPLPRDCYSCHQQDYASAPNHASFSRQCEQCHGTSTFQGATFRHRFPRVGPHNVSCAVCHPGGNTTTFTCVVCHDHSREEMDKRHDEVGGYTYTSSRCFQCHPGGEE